MKDNCYLLLFELIQVAIGTRKCLSRIPEKKEWYQVYKVSQRQALIGVCFTGVHLISAQNQIGHLPHQLKMQWLSQSLQLQQRNAILNSRCLELQEMLSSVGVRSVILKGQGVAALYSPEIAQFRQSGDIDVWVDGTREQVIKYAVGIKPTTEFDEKHIHFDCFADTPVELHWIPVKKWNPRWNRLLNQYFEREKERQFSKSGDGIHFPTVDFQLTHQLLHVLGHFLSGGVGLRQMMDLYFAQQACLEQLPEKIPEVLSLFKQLRLMKFVAATQWVIKEVFSRESNLVDKLICAPNEKEGKYLLNEIEVGGNFGQYNASNSKKDKTFFGRFWRKWTRLMKYDLFGSIVMPFARFKLEIWMRIERRKLKV